MSDNERGKPRRVGEGLDALARRLGAPTAASMGAVFTRWDEAVGPLVAAHASPIALRDGVLTVGVDDPAWATQLRYLKNELLTKIAGVAGPGVVGRIDLRVVPPKGPAEPRR